MTDSKSFSDTRFLSILSWLFQPTVLALGAIVVLYGLIFWSVNKGVSIDEGYYLLGYLKGQSLGPSTTDFHRIGRTLFFFIPEDNVLIFRWTTVILTIGFLLLFLWSAYGWIKKKPGTPINKTLFYTLGLLSGTMCFAYASPVIYYDNLQLLLYLLAFSLFFLADAEGNSPAKYIWYFTSGLFLVFSLTNYPPSGILLFLVIMFLIGLFEAPVWKKAFLSWGGILAGILAGIIIYSLFIYDIRVFFQEAIWAYENSAKSAKDKYHTDGQLLVVGKYLLGMLKVHLPLLGLALVYFFLVYRKALNRMLLNTIFGAILVVLTYKFSGYFSNILLLPLFLLTIDVVIFSIRNKTRIPISKNIWFIIVLVMIPVIAVAGSNQRLEMKMVYFMPFWFLAYFLLLAELRNYLDNKQINIRHTVFIMVFFIVFSAQGFLKHIHYNYSIKRSTHLIENAVRFKNIGVSEYQCNFYKNGITELSKAGFKPGDEILAFYETFMLVYAAGGYVPHRLTYSAEFFVGNKENIPLQKPPYIIIDDYQVPMLTEFLEETDWDFPNSYNMVELGTDGHNLTQLGYNYMLFYSKKKPAASDQ